MAGRLMRCGRCGAEWTAAAKLPSAAMACPYCNVHVCGCGCGADLSDQRRDSIYRAESHWRQLLRDQSSDVAPIRTVAEARALQDAAKAHWSMVADEAIYRYFEANLEGRPFHADELEEVGIPLEHRNAIGSQIAKWVNRGYMVGCGRRKSSFASRRHRKSNEYRLTEAGVEHVRKGRIAGDSSANGEGTVGLRSAGTLDRPGPAPAGHVPTGAPSSRTAVSGEGSAGGAAPSGAASAEPARLPGLGTPERRAA